MRWPRNAAAWLAAIAAGALLAPAAATADDQSIYNAFHNTHPRFKELRKDFERGVRHWESSGWRDPEPAYRACRKTASLAKLVSKRMKDRTPSSETGAAARSKALKGLNHRRLWADAERRAIEAFMRFDGDGYRDRRAKAKTYIRQAQQYEKRAFELFRKAGVEPNP